MHEPSVAITDAVNPLGLRALAGRSVVYALGGLAYKGIALVTVPLLARLLEPAQLGLLDAAAILASIVGLVAGLGGEQAVAYLEPRLRQDAKLWSTALALTITAGFALFALVAVLSQPIAALLTGDAANRGIVIAAGIYGIVIALTAAGLNAVRLRGTPPQYAVSSFAVVTAEMAVGLLIAWQVAERVQIMILGWAGASAVVTALVFARHLPALTRPDFGTAARLLRFGAPLVPAAIAWMAGDAAIRSAIARDAGLADLGAYGIAYRVSTGLGIFVTGFAIAWQPYLYRADPRSVRPRARRTAPALVIALGWGATIMTLFAHEIVAVVAGAEYTSATGAIGALAGGMIAFGLFMLLGALAGSTGRTLIVGLFALLGAVTQAAAATALIGPFGLAGAGCASALGYVVATVVLALATRFFVLDRPGLALLTVGAVTAVALGSAVVVADSMLVARLLAAGVVTLIAVGGLTAMRRATKGLNP